MLLLFLLVGLPELMIHGRQMNFFEVNKMSIKWPFVVTEEINRVHSNSQPFIIKKSLLTYFVVPSLANYVQLRSVYRTSKYSGGQWGLKKRTPQTENHLITVCFNVQIWDSSVF